MGFPRDLDTIPDSELLAELERRRKYRQDGKCDYCGRGRGTPACQFEDRHRGVRT